MGIFKLFKSKEEKQIIKLSKTVDKIEALEEKYQKYSNEELKQCTEEFKNRLSKGETLDDILVEAFAVVREASKRVLNMRHFRVQLLGGIVLHQGRIAEMRTGEGKTLVATLPAYLNALTGKGMHVVTVNDYLATRDSEWMGKIYKFLGLSVGCLVSQMKDEDRKKAYSCDILYATNNELGFDYLRDNMAIDQNDKVQRELEFAIIDEVDNILIDEARTPLIISGTGSDSSELYKRADSFVKFLNKDDYIEEEKEKTVRLSDEGVTKAEKYFNIENLADIENQEIMHHINNALKANVRMHKDQDYIVQDGEILIVDEFTGRIMVGRRYSDGLHQAIEAKEGVRVKGESQTLATITFQNYFRLYKKLSGMTGTAKTEENEFQDIYGLDVVVLPTNLPIQRKDQVDKIYSEKKYKYNAILEDIKDCYERKQPVLVGTVTVDRSEELATLLQKNRIPCNVLNAKNHEREAEIVAQAGKLGQVTIATNMAGRGTDIMLGGNPEYLALERMKRDGYKHEIIAQVTSFAPTEDEEILKAKEVYKRYYELFKKDTDKEKQEVIKAGGLRIIGTEKHESRRIDNQLRGRSGRQGDPGSSIFYLSMEDDVLRVFGGDRMKSITERLISDKTLPIESKFMSTQIDKAQARVEDRNLSARKYVLNYDNTMNKQRELIYKERNRVLNNETNIHEEILDMIGTELNFIVGEYCDQKLNYSAWDYEAFNRALEDYFLPRGTNLVDKEFCKSQDPEEIREKLYKEIIDKYEQKIKEVEENGIDFKEIEKTIVLRTVDMNWIEHIDNMEKLKEAAGLRAYGQKDPVLVYAKEGLEMFNEMSENIRSTIVKILCTANFERQITRKKVSKDEQMSREEQKPKKEKKKQQTVVRTERKIGRNEPCICGSGKKYKNCCGINQE